MVRLALQELKSYPDLLDCTWSRFYWTSPVSPIPQPHFLNGVCRVRTSLSLITLFSVLQQIEWKLGKKRKDRDAPRKIDLDLLFYDTEIYTSEELIVPHPRWMEREFVLRPLSELTQEFDVERRLSELPKEARCLLPLSPVLVL